MMQVRSLPYDRGWGTAFMREDDLLLRVQLADEPAVTTPALPATGRRIEPLDISRATPVDIQLTRNDVEGKFFLGINGKPFGGEDHVHARVGETQVWTVTNTIAWDHPFHLHGFFFQVLPEPSAAPAPLEWKDTANVAVKSSIRIAVKYDDRPGMWMFHCHLLDHADAGMMGMVMVEK